MSKYSKVVFDLQFLFLSLFENRFLEFISRKSKTVLQLILLPKQLDPCYQLIYGQSDNAIAKHQLNPLQLIYQGNCLENYLKFHFLNNLQFLFFNFYGSSKPPLLSTEGGGSSLKQWQRIEEKRIEIEKFQKYLSVYLEEHDEKKTNLTGRDNPKESSLIQQFLTTSHQLNEVFTKDNLQYLFSMIADQLSNVSSVKKSSSSIKRESTVSACSELSHFTSFHQKLFWNFLDPFHSQLIRIQQYSFELIDSSYSLIKHFQFMKDLFFFGTNTHYDSLKELCHFYVYFPSALKTTPNSRGSNYQHEFYSEEFHLLNNLKSSIALMIEDELPKKGIQSYYFHFPVLTDFFQKHQMMNKKLSGQDAPTTSVFSHIFTTIIKEMKLEIFYSWPISSIFHQSMIASLHQIHSYLLSLQIMKWFVEFYWKSIISSNSLNIEYNYRHQMIKERRSTGSKLSSPKKTSTKRNVDSEDADDENERQRMFETEEKVEQTATIMKEIIHIYDIEKDIYHSKRQIQLQLVYLISLIKSLYDYSLSYIHEFLWKEFENKVFPPKQRTTKKKEKQPEGKEEEDESNKVTVAMIRYYFDEMIYSIQSFMNIFYDVILQDLFPLILQCFHELHKVLLFENQYQQQKERERLSKEQKKSSSKDYQEYKEPDGEKITNNQRLIEFRKLENQFATMKKSMKKVYFIIKDHSNSKKYYSHAFQKKLSDTSGFSGKVGSMLVLSEHRKKVLLYQMKLFQEMNLRLNEGNQSF
jgi:hypothetical protein